MNKKQIKQLALASYSEGKLDEKTVEKVSTLLKRKDLKTYIRALKLEEKKHMVSVAVPVASVYNKTAEVFFDVFPGKEVHVSEDKLLLFGAKVAADDMVYDFSLKSKLDDFLYTVEDTYGQD